MISSEVKYRVIYRDTDKMGVVYHANYIAFYEIARTEMFRSLGIPYSELEKMGVMTPIVEVESKYKAPAYYDDLLTIRATIKELPAAKMDVEYEVFNEQGTLINTGRTLLGYVNMERLRPCRAPQVLIDRLRPHFE